MGLTAVVRKEVLDSLRSYALLTLTTVFVLSPSSSSLAVASL
ncbi:hypothetical protein [Halovenus marina]